MTIARADFGEGIRMTIQEDCAPCSVCGVFLNALHDPDHEGGHEYSPRAGSDREAQIRAECQVISDLLAEKNRAYGDSALNPVRVFSKASPVEQILVRLDDKLSRLARGSAAGEDVILDLIGYLVLLRIAQRGAP